MHRNYVSGRSRFTSLWGALCKNYYLLCNLYFQCLGFFNKNIFTKSLFSGHLISKYFITELYRCRFRTY